MAKKKSAGKSAGKAAGAGAKTESAVSRYGGWIAAYGVVAFLTFLFQLWVRLPICEGFTNCALSLLKGLVWSLIWPTYWVVYLLRHSPWKSLRAPGA
jgi:hypothetical protein